MVSICIICQDDERTEMRGLCCTTCIEAVRYDLRAIDELTRAAGLSLSPTRAPGGASSAKPGSRAPVDLGALDDALGFHALAVLESWERIIREDYGMARYGTVTEQEPASVARSVAFLTRWLDKLAAGWPAVDEMAREIEEVANSLGRHRPQARGLDRLRRMVARGIDRDGLEAWLDLEAAALLTGYSQRHLRRLAGQGRIERRDGLYSVASIRRAGMSRASATLGA